MFGGTALPNDPASRLKSAEFVIPSPVMSPQLMREKRAGEELGIDRADRGLLAAGADRRRVELGARGGDRVEVLSGIEAGARVVVEGTFTLKSAARQGELGGGHSH